MVKKILEEILIIGKGERKGKNIGYQISAEFYGVKNISYVHQIEPILNKALNESKLNIVKKPTYHQFNPHGVTAFALLEESHISIHTWPEYDYLSLDIFSCSGEKKAEIAYKVFKYMFKPKEIKKIIIYKKL
ncbi:MAG: adenosylmethionine decarboxylase [Candidatus Pacearchaeota archaeon]